MPTNLMDELLDRVRRRAEKCAGAAGRGAAARGGGQDGVTEITQKEARVRFALGEVDLKQLSAVCGMKKYHSRLRLDARCGTRR